MLLSPEKENSPASFSCLYRLLGAIWSGRQWHFHLEIPHHIACSFDHFRPNPLFRITPPLEPVRCRRTDVMAANGRGPQPTQHDLNCLTITELEKLARERMDKQTRDYYNEGSDSGSTLSENIEAYGKYRIRPRVLRDISQIDTSTSVFGHKVTVPFGVAPTGIFLPRPEYKQLSLKNFPSDAGPSTSRRRVSDRESMSRRWDSYGLELILDEHAGRCGQSEW